ncbi:MAG TPA: DUF5009 domain-containing protein [Cyclobacteriaceae bacterium]|nr:DUF5009 domain-containing protein [Cyclobacteriaceae bacterium]
MPDNPSGHKEPASSTFQPATRIYSLDALRGFDMFWITGGEGLVHALAIAGAWSVMNSLGNQLHHVKWEGFRFYDLIFPLFMFISGVAIPFAMTSKIQKGTAGRELFKKILRRLVILFIFGMIYNQFWWNDWTNPRIASVLGQIAFAYFFAALIFIKTQKIRSVIIWACGILAFNAILQLFVPVPGFGAGVLTPEGSMNAFIDQRLLPGLLLDKTFDPEGVLNIVSATSVTLMGVIAGLILMIGNWSSYKKFTVLVIIGIILVVLSFLLRNDYPMIKKAWTSTYDMHAAGYSFVLLALFYLVIDIWKFRKWSFYFTVIGMNAITVYMGTHVIDFMYTSKGLLGGLTMHLGPWGEVVLWIAYLGIVWLCLYTLYRNKIFLRV